MRKRRNRSNGPTRRAWLETGLAALAFPALARGAEAEADQVNLRPYDSIEPERYPWGWIRWLMSGKIDPKAEMTMGLVQIEPNQSNTLHVHPNSAEYLHVLSGVSEHLVDGKWVTLKPGDTLRIPRNVPHQARSKDEPFRALIVYDTPNRIMVPVVAGKPAADRD
jgi:quercetin dioxygenase-like cupin family protein